MRGRACLYDGNPRCANQDRYRDHAAYFPLPYIGPGFTRKQLLATYPPAAVAAAAAGKQ